MFRPALVLSASLVATSALAGPHAGGVLFLHSNPALEYTTDQASYCGESGLPVCQAAVTDRAGAEIAVIHLLAAFSPENAPRLTGATFGIEYPLSVLLVDQETCADFEIADDAWPASGSGTAIVFLEAQTASVTELYWFAAYNADAPTPAALTLIPHPTQGAYFSDDAVPSHLDPIAALGSFGFDTPGYAPCPEPPPGAGACCLDDGSCIVRAPDDCATAGGVYQGGNTTCEPNPCPPPPPGACCLMDQRCEQLSEMDCSAQGGAFQGAGVSCDPNPCPATPEACCFEDGSCAELTAEQCVVNGGVPGGAGSDCVPNPCQQPARGACCFDEGNCFPLRQSECASQGGDYLGDDTSCDPNPCPQLPTGACCGPDGSCYIIRQDLCAVGGGIYQGDNTSCDPNPCPQPPVGACCFPGQVCNIQNEFTCNVNQGAYQGDGTVCIPNTCPEDLGGCCLDDGFCFVATEADCVAQGGHWVGAGSDCEPYPCGGPPGDCAPVGRFGIARAGTDLLPEASGLTWQDGARPSSAARGGCPDLRMNADGEYENGYSWRYGGVAPPYYGAFAECYGGSGSICAAVLDITQIGSFFGQSMDVYVWDDYFGCPGNVLCVTPGFVPEEIAYWPAMSRIEVPLSSCCVSDAWWIGYWPNWPLAGIGWFIGADLDGGNGCPVTNIAPGIGYPTGWRNVSVAWGPTQALGIGVRIEDCGGTPVRETTWGAVKQLFR